ncbi:hypothetical protein Tco_1260831 [Tanacetum coccineum]
MWLIGQRNSASRSLNGEEVIRDKSVSNNSNCNNNGVGSENNCGTEERGNDVIKGVFGSKGMGEGNQGVNTSSVSLDDCSPHKDVSVQADSDEGSNSKIRDKNEGVDMNDDMGNKQDSCEFVGNENVTRVKGSMENKVKSGRSFVAVSNQEVLDKKLVDIPTEVDWNGNEIVVFDEVMVVEGSKK